MSAPELGYSEADGIVTVRMTRDNWNGLIMCLGCAAASSTLMPVALRVANEINRGNPAYTPYEVPEEEHPNGRT